MFSAQSLTIVAYSATLVAELRFLLDLLKELVVLDPRPLQIVFGFIFHFVTVSNVTGARDVSHSKIKDSILVTFPVRGCFEILLLILFCVYFNLLVADKLVVETSHFMFTLKGYLFFFP